MLAELCELATLMPATEAAAITAAPTPASTQVRTLRGAPTGAGRSIALEDGRGEPGVVAGPRGAWCAGGAARVDRVRRG